MNVQRDGAKCFCKGSTVKTVLMVALMALLSACSDTGAFMSQAGTCHCNDDTATEVQSKTHRVADYTMMHSLGLSNAKQLAAFNRIEQRTTFQHWLAKRRDQYAWWQVWITQQADRDYNTWAAKHAQ